MGKAMTKSALKIVEARLSPERERLAELIAVRKSREAELARAEKASETLRDERYKAMSAIDDAKAKVKQATLDAPRIVTARLLGEPLSDVLTVAEAEQAVRDAESNYESLVSAKEPIEQAIAIAKIGVANATMDCRYAAQAVVRSEIPHGLAERFGNLSEEYHSLFAIMAHIDGIGVLGEADKGWRYRGEEAWKVGDRARKSYAAALGALSDDANAPLPPL